MFFESISWMSSSSFLFTVKNLMIKNEISSIFIVNFDLISEKIFIRKMINHIIILNDTSLACLFTNSSFVIINYVNDTSFTDESVKSNLTLFQLNMKKNTEKINFNISDHWESEYALFIREILNKHKTLFQNHLSLVRNAEMLISFKNNNDIFQLKQALFNLFMQNCWVMNLILDNLVKQQWVKKISLRELSLVMSSAFIMWRNEKSHVVVNLRCVNTKLLLNVYFLLKQDIILFALKDSIIFSSLNIIKSFFQVSIALKNRWKTSFVTSHCDHEKLMIFTMRLTNLSDYFQHLMKNLLKSYLWKNLLVYIDNIIIFSAFSNQHCKHLNVTFSQLSSVDFTLFIDKCHFVYLFLNLLKHKIYCLNLST